MHPWYPWYACREGSKAHVQPCSPHGTVSVERRQAAGVRAMHPWHACREGTRGLHAALLPSRHSLRGYQVQESKQCYPACLT